MPSLTEHLLHLDESALTAATKHPFLAAAANAALPTDKLKHWLAQDRLYALSYVSFIGTLLSRVSVPVSANRSETLNWRATSMLIDCLTNIRTEIQLFEDSAAEEGWLDDIASPAVTTPPARPTRSYQDLFAGALAQGRPLLVGLVVLWATEECYLRAWTHAWEQMPRSKRSVDGKPDIMQRAFIPNWSSAEFAMFVKKLGQLVDEMVREQGVEEGGWVWKECEAAWRQVVWCEREFWPEVHE